MTITDRTIRVTSNPFQSGFRELGHGQRDSVGSPAVDHCDNRRLPRGAAGRAGVVVIAASRALSGEQADYRQSRHAEPHPAATFRRRGSSKLIMLPQKRIVKIFFFSYEKKLEIMIRI